MKKAQTEMLGIAIVVILISIGILFIVANSLRSSGQVSQKQQFSEKQLSANILGSMLSTSTNCQKDRISTVLIDCGNGVPRDCGGESIAGVAIGYTNEPCVYLNQLLTVMLNETLGKWNKKYQFLAYKNPNSPEINITNRIDECLSGQGEGFKYLQKSSYYLPLLPGLMTVELGLCS
jgi:hypothetical protein